MASPNTLALREEMAGLRPRPIVTPPPAHDGQLRAQPSVEFARLSVARHLRRKREITLTNQDRVVPVGGPGRRRAKAARNKRAVTGLLTDVLAYCDAHPHRGALPDAQELTLHRNADGAITAEGPIPDVIDVSCMLLDSPYRRGLDFVGGVLVLSVKPERLRYRPLGRCPHLFAVRFQRIAA